MNKMLFLGLAQSAGTMESFQVGKGQLGIGQSVLNWLNLKSFFFRVGFSYKSYTACSPPVLDWSLLILLTEGTLGLFVARYNSLLKPLPVLNNHIVNNLSTEDTSPSPKMFLTTIELFVSHGSTTAIALQYVNSTTKLSGSLSGWPYKVNENLKSPLGGYGRKNSSLR